MAGQYELMTDREREAYRVKQAAGTRKTALEATVQGNLKKATGSQGGDIQSLQQQLFDGLTKMSVPDAKTDRPGHMAYLGERIAALRTKAKEVKKSKSGNIKAEQTYNQAADLLQQQLSRLQSEDVGASEEALHGGEGQ